jgi:cytochrome b561
LTSQDTLRYKASMNTMKRFLAALELLLVFPASLFMLALFLRNVQPAPYEPAQTARRLVDWFAARPHLGLDVFLIALPFAALVIGCATVLRAWRTEPQLRQATQVTVAAVRAHFAALLIAGATLVAGCILAIVAMHMITD